MYDAALERFKTFAARDRDHVAQACRTLLLSHGHRTEHVTLFLHGLTASPQQFAALADDAHRRGHNVLVPRLPRHGHRDRLTPTLRNLRGDELLACVDESLAIARGLGRSVHVVGFSLGGLLATWIAYHHHVESAVAIAPFLGVAWIPRRLTATIARCVRALPNVFVWWDPLRRANLMPLHGYPRYATHAIAEALFIAGDLVSPNGPRAPRSPILLVTNDGEMGVNNAAVRQLADDWSAHPGPSVEHHRVRDLGPSHDIIEPLCERTFAARSYPQLNALIERARRER